MQVSYTKSYCTVDVDRKYGLLIRMNVIDCEDIKVFKYQPDSIIKLEEENIQYYETAKEKIDQYVKVSRRNSGYSNTITFFIQSTGAKYEEIDELVSTIPSFIEEVSTCISKKYKKFLEMEKVLNKFDDKGQVEEIEIEI